MHCWGAAQGGQVFQPTGCPLHLRTGGEGRPSGMRGRLGVLPIGPRGSVRDPPGISITGMLRRHSHLKLTGISSPRAPRPRPRPAAAPQEPLRYRWAKRAPRGAVHIQRVTLYLHGSGSAVQISHGRMEYHSARYTTDSTAASGRRRQRRSHSGGTGIAIGSNRNSIGRYGTEAQQNRRWYEQDDSGSSIRDKAIVR